MRLVRTHALIGPSEEELEEVEFLVDTGSFYTFLPPAVAAAFSIALPGISRVITVDSRTVEVPLGVAYLRLQDREGEIIVGALEAPMPLLGASALEALGCKVDPVSETLEHSRPFGPAAL